MFGALPAELILDLAKKQGAYYQLDLDLDCPPWVFVKPEYLTGCTKGFSVVTSSGKKHGSMSTEDHPYFRDTRNWLAQNGYIKMQTNWINGDRVTKPFYFNNIYMDVGDQFSCASAMSYQYGKEEVYNNGEPLHAPNYSVDNYKDTPVWPDDIKEASFPASVDYVEDELDDLF